MAWNKVANLRGPQGEQGAKGDPGEQGPQGAKGDPGQRGSRWTSGEGAPTSTDFLAADYYLDTATGDVYQAE